MKYASVEDIKTLRVGVDALLQQFKNMPEQSDPVNEANAAVDLYHGAHFQAEIKLNEAKMWLGKMLEGLGNPFPAELADKSQ